MALDFNTSMRIAKLMQLMNSMNSLIWRPCICRAGETDAILCIYIYACMPCTYTVYKLRIYELSFVKSVGSSRLARE